MIHAGPRDGGVVAGLVSPDFTRAIFIGSLRQASAVGFRDVRRKVSVSLRLDPEMLAWLRGKGPGI